jgi:large subunit ribosomal protein L19
MHSPFLANIEVIKEGKVKRAKLFYLRKIRGKAAKIEEMEKEEGKEEEEAKE